MLSFEQSTAGCYALNQTPSTSEQTELQQQIQKSLPAQFMRTNLAQLPELSELDVIRHFTRLSQENFSIDSNFYPLGSCTMKYNPKGVHQIAMIPGFINRHPYASAQHSQGILSCLYEFQNYIAEVTGFSGVSLSPMAGAQGEFAGVAMIRAYHQARGDSARQEMLVPDSAHGTNPASAVMCGYRVREIATDQNGDLDIAALKAAVGPQTAGIMLTNPSTLGLFERNIEEIAAIMHEQGGLLYYDGANLNAILGRVRPGDMGFDVMHLNLHKTFATPHGGGGPGCGPVAVNDKLKPFLPTPIVGKTQNQFHWVEKQQASNSIGRLSAFMGNIGIVLRAYSYLRLLGKRGLRRVSEIATLNANYLMQRLADSGFELAYPERRASHEFIITFQSLAKQHGITATHFAKRLLDFGIHAPTMYFPLTVPECWLVEPTETESKQTLDKFVSVMQQILLEAKQSPEKLQQAPLNLALSRLDEVHAARSPDVVFTENNQ